MKEADIVMDRVRSFMGRRGASAEGNVRRDEHCQPRLLIRGHPRMGQIQMGKAIVNRLVEKGYHVETLGQSFGAIEDEIQVLFLNVMLRFSGISLKHWM